MKFRRNRRGVASYEQAAFFSPLVLTDGMRPRSIRRTDPINEYDSGWSFYEGSETDEWLNEDGHCLLSHLAHAAERWPELAEPLRDAQPRSWWSWDPVRARYVKDPD